MPPFGPGVINPLRPTESPRVELWVVPLPGRAASWAKLKLFAPANIVPTPPKVARKLLLAARMVPPYFRPSYSRERDSLFKKSTFLFHYPLVLNIFFFNW